MIDVLFPVDIGRNFRRNLLGGDTVLKNRNGYAFFLTNQPPGGLRGFSYPRNLLAESERQTIESFFLVAQNSQDGFLYKDWKDYTATKTYIGTGDGSTTEYDLQKRYSVNGYTVDRRLYHPVNDDVDEIYYDDIAQGSGWTFNTTTKKIVFSVAPALNVVIESDYQFYIPVRFEDGYVTTSDYLQISNSTIQLIEFKLNV